MSTPKDDPFFIGYLRTPQALRPFLAAAVLLLIGAAALLAYAIAATQDDPGPGALRGDLGRQTVTGLVELTPTPIFHVIEGTEAIPAGRTLMMSGQGKNGTAARAVPLAGQLAVASGALLQRGDLEMLQLRGGANGLAPGDGPTPALPAPEPLGRWALTGEICDGKCAAGIMRPGRGISHKACANLCLIGGVPPVFITTAPVAGQEFLMIAGTAEDALPPGLYDWVAQYVQLEGEVTRHGDLLVLQVDETSVRRAP